MNKNYYSDAPQTIREFITYEQITKGRSELTVKNYYMDIRLFLRYYKVSTGRASDNAEDFSKISIADITDADLKAVDLQTVQEFLLCMKEQRDNELKARRRKAVSLRQFYKFLTNYKHMFDVNPMANLELPKSQPALPKYLTYEQALDILANVDTPDKKRDYCMIVFLLNCGMRLSELVGIDLKDIRCTAGADGAMEYSLKVLGKGSKERVIYLNEACVNAYLDYVAPDEKDPDVRAAAKNRSMTVKTDALFLSSRGTRISNRRVQQIVEECLKRCGLDNLGLSVHKFRHTAATLMYRNGVNVLLLKEILGHENLGTTQIYTHVEDSQIRDAMKHNPLASVKSKK